MSTKMPTWPDVMKFDVPENAVIFDIGGYKGDWVQIALDNYKNPTIYVFEPVKKFFNEIVERWKSNPNVKVFNFGLSSENGKEEISLEGDSSSVFKAGEVAGATETIYLKDVREFLFEQDIFRVHLAKINIEGEEYRLMEYLISTPELNIFDNYLIQFHTFIDNHVKRRDGIVKGLSEYYNREFNYEFIFEGWSMKPVQKVNCFGDSHISIFSEAEKLIKENTNSVTDSFNAFRFGPYLAYNLPSKTNVVSKAKAASKDENLLLCFGEIDCRAQVNKVCEDTKRGYKEVIDEIVENYLTVASGANNKNTILFSITPELKENPHEYYYKDHSEVFDCPRGTMKERVEYKEYFNLRVKEGAEKLGFKFVSIYDYVSEKEMYYLDDIHLAPQKVFYLIKREMIKNGFTL